MKRVIYIDGGVGRVICSLPAIEKASKKDEIIVITPHTQVFMNNPNIYRILHPSTPYIFEDYIFDNNFEHPEPYQLNKYYRGELHLIQAFNFIINNDIELSKPNIYLTSSEIKNAKNLIQSLTSTKKILLFQPFGSSNSIVCNNAEPTHNSDASGRSLSENQANYILEKLKSEYEIIYIGDYLATSSESFHVLNLSIRDVFSLCMHADKFIGIDSFLMHAANAFNLPGLVIFGAMNSNNLCYKEHYLLKKENLNYEPLRMPVNMEFSKNKNNNSMDFSDEEIDKLLNKLCSKQELTDSRKI
jgi:ADP-heptose:LPS heptosyltransferase